MTTTNQLKHEVEILHKALNPTVPDSRLEDLLKTLKNLEDLKKEFLKTHTMLEWIEADHQAAQEVARLYVEGKLFPNEKVSQP